MSHVPQLYNSNITDVCSFTADYSALRPDYALGTYYTHLRDFTVKVVCFRIYNHDIITTPCASSVQKKPYQCSLHHE